LSHTPRQPLPKHNPFKISTEKITDSRFWLETAKDGLIAMNDFGTAEFGQFNLRRQRIPVHNFNFKVVREFTSVGNSRLVSSVYTRGIL
jgi:hypothetical protein